MTSSLLAILFFETVSSKIYTVPLSRHQPPHSSLQSRLLQESDLNLSSVQGMYYHGPVSIGNETYSLIFDTGSSLTWIPSSTCDGCHKDPSYTCERDFCLNATLTCGADTVESGAPSSDTASNTSSSHRDHDSPSFASYATSSSSPSAPFSLQYGSGSVKGYLALDTVTVGNLSTGNFLFGVAESVQLPDFSSDPFSGIAGLGWPALNPFDPGCVGAANLNGSTDDTSWSSNSSRLFKASTSNSSQPVALPLVMALQSSGEISKAIFGLAIGEESGSLTIGGVDESAFDGDMQWLAVTEKAWWKIGLVRVDVQGETGNLGLKTRSSTADAASPLSSAFAIVDSGTSLIAGPVLAIEGLVKQVASASHVKVTKHDSGVFSCKCDDVHSLLPVVFVLRGAEENELEFSLPGESLSVGRFSGDNCLLGFQAMDTDTWILGAPFLRAFYSAYDYDQARVGFAVAKSLNSTSVMAVANWVEGLGIGWVFFGLAAVLM